MEGSVSIRTNKLLAQLSEATLVTLLPYLRWHQYPSGTVLTRARHRPDFMFFPTSGVVARIVSMPDDQATEFALFGNEGLAGLSLLFGSAPSSNALGTSAVLIDSAGFQCSAEAVQRQLKMREFQEVVLRYAGYVLREAMQTALCNRYHKLSQQLCKWLLMCADRADSMTLNTTHDAISRMLGVRREGVSEHAGYLQQAGLIDMRRGVIRLRDRDALVRRACDCYHTLNQEYATVVHGKLSTPIIGRASAHTM